MQSKFRLARRRSFSCDDELWDRMVEASKDTISISEFIRRSVKEKLDQTN